MADPEEPSPLEPQTLKCKSGLIAHAWWHRWEEDVLWIHALLTAADNGGVAAYCRDKNPHGKKVSVEENLRKKFLEVAPPALREVCRAGGRFSKGWR